MAAQRFNSRVEQSNTYAGSSSRQPARSRAHASEKIRRNSGNSSSGRSRVARLDSERLGTGVKGMFEEPRSGNDRRLQLIPYMIPDTGCRRKRNRRSWRSHLNGEWWMLRDYLRRE